MNETCVCVCYVLACHGGIPFLVDVYGSCTRLRMKWYRWQWRRRWQRRQRYFTSMRPIMWQPELQNNPFSIELSRLQMLIRSDLFAEIDPIDKVIRINCVLKAFACVWGNQNRIGSVRQLFKSNQFEMAHHFMRYAYGLNWIWQLSSWNLNFVFKATKFALLFE